MCSQSMDSEIYHTALLRMCKDSKFRFYEKKLVNKIDQHGEENRFYLEREALVWTRKNILSVQVYENKQATPSQLGWGTGCSADDSKSIRIRGISAPVSTLPFEIDTFRPFSGYFG